MNQTAASDRSVIQLIGDVQGSITGKVFGKSARSGMSPEGGKHVCPS